MRHIFFLIIILILGCSKSVKDTKNISTNAEPPVSEMDTFYAGKILFKVNPLKANEFDNLKDTNLQFDTSEAINIKIDSNWVKRIGDTLKLTTEAGEILVVNNLSDSDDLSEYEYLYYDAPIHQYVIAGSYWEGNNYVLVDKLTGEKTNSIGLPSLSPNGKYFLAGNCDLVAGFTFNGITIYKNSSPIEVIGSKELYSWGPLDYKWKNDSTIYTKVSISDTNSTTLERTEYLKLTIKE